MGITRDTPNFGDELTPDMVHALTGRTSTWAHPKRADLIGSGSTLEMMQVGGARPGLKVWGAGFMTDNRKRGTPDFDFYAVRGHLTLDRIDASRPVAVGDPGLLASRVYPRSATVPGRRGLVYHYVHRRDAALKRLSADHTIMLIDPLRDPADVVADITSCEFIYATSLHGLITADAFGIPNAWISMKRRLGGGRYKFEDYYSAFGGDPVQHSADIMWDAAVTSRLDSGYRSVGNLREIQASLIDALHVIADVAA